MPVAAQLLGLQELLQELRQHVTAAVTSKKALNRMVDVLGALMSWSNEAQQAAQQMVGVLQLLPCSTSAADDIPYCTRPYSAAAVCSTAVLSTNETRLDCMHTVQTPSPCFSRHCKSTATS